MIPASPLPYIIIAGDKPTCVRTAREHEVSPLASVLIYPDLSLDAIDAALWDARRRAAGRYVSFIYGDNSSKMNVRQNAAINDWVTILAAPVNKRAANPGRHSDWMDAAVRRVLPE